MTEELKIVMETIGQLGQAGKEAFIWWLLVKYALHYFTVAFFIVGVIVAVRIVAARIAATTHGNQLANELYMLLDIQHQHGCAWENEYYRPQVKALILAKVRELKKEAGHVR